MLSSLHVQNYVLINSLDIDFPEGLIIITGQTGAGKSILLGALSLLLGAKADASILSEGAESCIVEAKFTVPGDDYIKELLSENDIDFDNGNIIVRRVVSSTGRSRSFVNDIPVQIGFLQTLSSRLIDVHSQHQTLMLSDKQFQLSMLDYYAGNNSFLKECKEAYDTLSKHKSELIEVQDELNKLETEKDYIQATLEKLDNASLRVGELEELESEQVQLSNAEEIKGDFCQVESMLSPSGDSDSLPVTSLLKEVVRVLAKVSKYVPQTEELSRRVESSRIELDDILSEISVLESKIDVSPDRLQIVDDRLNLLYDLLKRHSCNTIEELIIIRDNLSSKISDSSSIEEKLEELRKIVAVDELKLDELASQLHTSRSNASKDFMNAITESIHSLELDRSVFEVKLNDAPISKTGKDSVQFLFSSNGTSPVDIAKCASGGELSRIMLALKAMLAKYTNMPTMVFDEIDTGVSGSVADKMGTMICSMGNDMQVFAITHLPQVAAKGNAHYLVEKNFNPASGKTVTEIKLLEGNNRVMEVARMLSGSSITDAAIANAKSLLSI